MLTADLNEALSLVVAITVTTLRPGDTKLRRALEIIVDHQVNPAIGPQQLGALVSWTGRAQ